MKKIFIVFICCVTILSFGIMCGHERARALNLKETQMNYENLTDCFKDADNINVMLEGITKNFKRGEKEYKLIIDTLYKITLHSHEMPAFGVSLDNLTRDDMKNGSWIELCFNQTMSHEAMTFDSLLMRIENNHFGFNLIRKNNNKYDGRCFYLSLDNSTKELYEAIGKCFN